ncbi:MAG: HAD-IC family P-type ATPase [Candidatus Eisenbacteria bacterium]|uniref:HAD-IC family P-type ATPase n=1 Tax=Eiseniibacteriota bacterium TaxID=2212470 RepID=A0A937X8Z4_UNCEI|nr:HAD-IC family P-type ATPase [Candidatus Eisenbacteria bacterium]
MNAPHRQRRPGRGGAPAPAVAVARRQRRSGRGEPSPAGECAWHACPEDDVFRRLEADREGLSESAALERLQAFGRNTLPGKAPPSLPRVILHQFKNPLIYILLIAGGVSLAIGDLKDAIFIFAVIVLNTVIGTTQEWRAERSAHALQDLLRIRARVKRAGEVETVEAEELVPGDLVLVESGDKVPADLRLLQATSLAIDESFLTGESLPVEKRPGVLDGAAPVSERTNMAFAGATVITGRGLGLATATGASTEVGRIARSVSEGEGAKPPLVIRMERFSRQVGVVVLAFAAALGAFSILRGAEFRDVFFIMIAMAVSAIPEGLPVAMTVALSLATGRMAARKVIARRLVAVESLGSCTTIASDKTGTLTVNQQTVRRIVLPDGTRAEISGQGYNDEGEVALPEGGVPGEALSARLRDLARAGVLCNEGALSKRESGWRHSGDSMDVALLALGLKMGVDPEGRREHIVGERPFESEARYAAVAYRRGDVARVFVKGAIEAVAPFCARMRTGSGDVPIEPESLMRQAQELAEGGYRVLAFAERPLAPGEGPEAVAAEKMTGLVLLGLVGFIDPLRAEVGEAVARARRAGVKVVMITGDHPATALAIARELDISDSADQVITGAEMAQAMASDAAGLRRRLGDIRVFARVTPQQKLDIVDSLMELGDFVAVTGDGVNDAPALHRANIGVAMGSGTEVAKDAAQIIVTDDNFASIVNGIEEGRFAYANVRKVTLFLVSTGFAELVLIGGAVLMNMPVPMLAAQLLWLNLVTNGIQDVALAFEAGEKGVMDLPPRRPKEGIFNRRMLEQVLTGGLTMALLCLVAWTYLLGRGVDVGEARNILFALMFMMQFYHVLNCRSEHESAFRVPLRNNRILIAGMLAAFAIHLTATHLSVTQSLLRIEPLPVGTWLILGAVGSALLAVMEAYKRLRRDSVAAPAGSR